MNEQIYTECPKYETESFILRLVDMDDAEELLECYSDKLAVDKMNADNCTSNFYFQTVEEMKECISFWLDLYKKQCFVRFSVIEKQTQNAVGTIEIFGGEYGVLRIDLCTKYEEPKYIEELIRIAIYDFVRDFEIQNLEIKAINTPGRMPLLEKYGFVPSATFRPGSGYYERRYMQYFFKEKGIAYCGLACCVCSENKNCAGCRNEGCIEKDWCKSFNCCKSKKIDGCWECKDFPCDNPMFKKIRVIAFANFIAEFGEDKLIEGLKQNEQKGMLYHYTDKLVGDYDLVTNEEELIKILQNGI